jgi:predicted O-methyltransferase YrrM
VGVAIAIDGLLRRRDAVPLRMQAGCQHPGWPRCRPAVSIPAVDRWAEVDAYIAERLLPRDVALDAAARSGLPRHEVSPPQGALLELLARLAGARAILELGTLAGYSTLWLARALPPGGRLVTIEADPSRAEVARANLAHVEGVEVRAGRALDVLPKLPGPFDLIFIDADKRSNAEYLDWALRLSRPGTLIVADNVVRGGAVIDPDGDASVQGARAFFDRLAAEGGVTATAIQTVGAKGYDGFALALVGAVSRSRSR